MMIVHLLGSMVCIDPKNLTILHMPQISTTQDTASDAYSIIAAIFAAFGLSLASYIQEIAGTTTLKRHTRMFTVFRRQ